MEQQFQDIREQQKATWNKFSSGWKKWDDLTMNFLKPVGDEIIRQLHLKDTDIVLDVAAGTGEPGFTIAAQLKGGKVVFSDLSDEMLAIAREKSERNGIRNVDFIPGDVCALPFEDNTFDAVSCRFGFMFFPDMLLAAKEMMRVLKPGGHIATSVWGAPEKNFWITAIMGAINRNMNLPAPPPGAPGIFRCAKDGFIADLFAQAGLKNISEKEITGMLDCQTTDAYWNYMTDIAAPVVAALSQADDNTKDKIRNEVHQLLNDRYTNGSISISSSATITSGQK
ncbi:MAG: class I SAM-dependent methyltransferase [Bacteroidetes bacterium]|nr:class I SAM-dependent methyltransferase [Bacteroidota bacterium]